MNPRFPRDTWQTLWRIGTSAGLLAALLLGLAAGLAVTVWLPQMPAEHTVAYAEWLSEVQARFGSTTGTLQALGLFSVTRSLTFRSLLSLLAACLALRVADRAERLHSHRAWREELPPLLAHLGGLISMAGLLISRLYGWQLQELVIRSGETLELPDGDGWVALAGDTGSLAHGEDIIAYVEERGPGVLASAANTSGAPLGLQRSANSEPADQLNLALTEDQFFAVPEVGLVVRLSPQSTGSAGDQPVLVQVYRSPPGELVAEDQLVDSVDLAVDTTTLHLVRTSYACVTVTRNPGRWFTGVGIASLAVGAVAVALLQSTPAEDEPAEVSSRGEG